MRQVEMMAVHEEGREVPWETSSIPDKELRWAKSVCPYCGVGCGLLVGEKNGTVHKVRGNPEHPANRGLLCAKGATLPLMLDTPDRLLYPQIRENRSSEWSRARWDEALGVIVEKTKAVLKTDGPEALAFYISGQLLTEDYYVVNKLAKGFLRTNNVDSNSRLCMASAVAGYATSLGADGPPTCYDDIERSECFFLIGTNTAACHPVTFQRIKNRKMSDPGKVKVIVADPRKTRTADIADLYLSLKPGTDVVLLNAMLHVIEKEGCLDEAFIRNHTAGWEELKKILPRYAPEKAAEICGIEASLIREAALLFGKASSALSFWSMGLNQSSSGVAKNNAVINLHLATGKIGKPGSGPFSLTGQPNAMGGRETGGLAHLLPGHRLVANERHRAEMETLWNVAPGTIAPKPGLTAIELFRAVGSGKVKIVWIAATNPLASLPNLNAVKAALAKAELVVCQEAYHPTETTEMAHVLLPAAQWSEREGTVTNSERRISYLEKIKNAPGEAKPDWQIFNEFAGKMGFENDFSFENTEGVYEEYKKTTRGTGIDIGGVSYARLKKEYIQWPFPEKDSKSTSRLYTDFCFPTPDGKAKFQTREYMPPVEITDEEYPFILTTGRVRDQWHTMTRTGKIDSLVKSEPYAFIELHRADAKLLGIEEGELVEVYARRGAARAPARLSEDIRQGTCFMPFHWGSLWGEAEANAVTIDALDPISKQPELKFCAVRVAKLEVMKGGAYA